MCFLASTSRRKQRIFLLLTEESHNSDQLKRKMIVEAEHNLMIALKPTTELKIVSIVENSLLISVGKKISWMENDNC